MKSQEKLTLEHLSAYLPYQVELEYKLPEWVEVQISKISMISSTHLRVYLENYNYSGWIENYKLRLRPLSDLTKEIEHNGEKFVPQNEFLKLYGSDVVKVGQKLWLASFVENIKNSPIETISFGVVQNLLEWHFDVFGLIDKGLAVSIHDVG